ncbi:hypothetical protein AYX14_07131 [Cryptococcus neoformans]|nr:hypothetical protein AYX14_07131 [Cryptococcus neoformans var. grubii]
MSREIVSEHVEFPFDVLDTEVEILEGTQPTKLARREIALAKEPLEREMITINELTVVYWVVTLGAIEGSRVVGNRLYRVPRSTDTDPCTSTGIRHIGE